MLKQFLIIIASLLFVAANAQSTDTTYKKEWKEIDKLILEKKLPKSALSKVNLIYAKAKQQKKESQTIKALLYWLSLEDEVNDRKDNASIKFLKQELATMKEPIAKAIMQLLLAKSYQSIYNNDSWQYNNRSKTNSYKPTDIGTWNKFNFIQIVDSLLTASLSNTKLLQATKLKDIDAITIKGTEKELRPTLFDLMAFEAIDCYTAFIGYNDEYANKPGLPWFKPSAVLLNHTFSKQDTINPVMAAMKVFKQVLQSHTSGSSPFIDANTQRIDWDWKRSQLPYKDSLYEKALLQIIADAGNSPVADETWYMRSRLHQDRGNQYSYSGDTIHRYEHVTAIQIINQRLTEQPKPSYGKRLLEELKEEILQKEINSKVEKANVPNQPFRLFVEYKNTDTLYYRIIKLNQHQSLDYESEEQWKKYAQLPVYKSSYQTLPQTNDHQQHAVEIKVDALPIGRYIILASTGKSFADSTDRMLVQHFTVSNLSFIQHGKNYFVLDRETGQPIESATILVNRKDYDYKIKTRSTNLLGIIKTNKDGFADCSKLMKDGYNSIELVKGIDTLVGEESYYNNYTNSNTKPSSLAAFEKQHAQSHFFTDRSIYRPGQTVYYKLLLTTIDSATGRPKLYLPKDSIKLYLKDANYKHIDSIKAKPNGFGSIAGSFKLPKNALTGNFSILTKDFYSSANFRVEEYKRRTFFIEFDEQTASYKLNDSIKVTGLVKTYSGALLNNASVKYTVTRGSNYDWMRPSMRKIAYPSGNSSNQVSQGTIITDAAGKFELTFKAVADSLQTVDSSQRYSFNIQIAATDISGETREETTIVQASYQSLFVSVDVPSRTSNNKFKHIPVATSNIAGKKQAATVQVAVTALQVPERATRKRFWNQPDQFVMDEKEFIHHFPYDEYKDESDHKKWKALATTVVTGSINTDKDSLFLLNKTLPQGWYKIECTAKDKDGRQVKASSFIEIFDATATALAAPAYDWEYDSNTENLQPNDTASLLIGSSMKDVYVIRNLQKTKGSKYNTNEEDNYSFIQLSNGKHHWQQPITEQDKGGIAMHYAFVKHSRFYEGGTNVSVPFIDKLLDVEYSTYRNKTVPGSEEKWSIKVKGSKKEHATAELLTAMYDASLDQFNRHGWNEPNLWNSSYNFNSRFVGGSFYDASSEENNGKYFSYDEEQKYNKLVEAGDAFWLIHNLNGYSIASISLAGTKEEGLISVHDMNPDIRYDEKAMKRKVVRGGSWKDVDYLSYSASFGNGAPKVEMAKFTPPKIVKDEETYNKVFSMVDKFETIKNASPQIQRRKNFSETAFFFPALYADTAGNYTFSFTMPEALTQWKWLSFAHTKDLALGSNSTYITTQKTLMVQPNAPRFMREGDNMEFVAKVSNLSDKELTGHATLELVDAATGNSVDGWFQNSFPVQYFTVAAGQSTVVKFPIQVPFNFNKALTWRVIAKADEFSDGEENSLPVLTNRMLVTEALPLYLKAGEKEKSFTFEKLLNNKSESLTHEGLTVEYTSNPIWSVVQSLPYLMEYPYECAEQTFNKLFANAMAASIVNKHPQIKAQFEKWKEDTTAFKSTLQQNEELKQILLQETPWVLNAENEAQQQKNIALLFDVVKMSQNINSIIEKLKQLQTSNGGFPWFKGGKEDRYITNYILTGIGKIKMMQSLTQEEGDKLYPIFEKALEYMDAEILDDYKQLIKNKADLSKKHISNSQIEYLYMRSFFVKPLKDRTAYNYYYAQAKQFWNKQNSYHAAMIALILHRNNERRFVNVNILPSLLENTVEDTTKGTIYWKNQQTCFWYENPIEHQAFMMNAINEIATKEGMASVMQKVDAAKTWLLLNKQTNNWKTTIATADACYAVLNTGSNWLSNNQQVQIKLGSQTISNQQQNNQPQTPNPKQATGYIKQRIEGNKAKNEMGNVVITTNKPINQLTNQPSYGAIYWQYFEDLDKITPAATPLSISKQLFIEKNTDKGKILEAVSDTNQLKVGDKLIVRMVLKTDRAMEYLHLKDMRASGTEPINVLSGYKWQDGLGYYEATKDASTNFFIDHMQKGTYVFEYTLYVTHTGTFSVGIASIQCMYAPEFTSHSEGMKIMVK